MKRLSVFLFVGMFALASCTPSAPIVPQTSDAEKVQDYNTVKGNAKDPVHGESVGFWYGAVAGVTGQKANGVAYMNRFADGTVRVTVNLNIAERVDEKHYVAYLTGKDPGNATKIGALESIIGDARHSVTLESTDLGLSEHRTVNVFLVDAIDSEEGIFLATGEMKSAQ